MLTNKIKLRKKYANEVYTMALAPSISCAALKYVHIGV